MTAFRLITPFKEIQVEAAFFTLLITSPSAAGPCPPPDEGKPEHAALEE